MEVLEERLNSFRNQKRFKWPLPASWRVNPETLARAGYYFKPQARNDDTAECFICQKSLGGWEENDDPYQEHRSHQASCPLCRLHDKDARMVTFDTWPDKRRGYKAFVKKVGAHENLAFLSNHHAAGGRWVLLLARRERL